jgi:hypothetical protein
VRAPTNGTKLFTATRDGATTGKSAKFKMTHTKSYDDTFKSNQSQLLRQFPLSQEGNPVCQTGYNMVAPRDGAIREKSGKFEMPRTKCGAVTLSNPLKLQLVQDAVVKDRTKRWRHVRKERQIQNVPYKTYSDSF